MEGCKSVAAGVNVMDLRSGINMAVDAVLYDLKSKALMISTSEEIKQVMDFLESNLSFWICLVGNFVLCYIFLNYLAIMILEVGFILYSG